MLDFSEMIALGLVPHAHYLCGYPGPQATATDDLGPLGAWLIGPVWRAWLWGWYAGDSPIICDPTSRATPTHPRRPHNGRSDADTRVLLVPPTRLSSPPRSPAVPSTSHRSRPQSPTSANTEPSEPRVPVMPCLCL